MRMCLQFASQACPAANARQLERMASPETIPERVEQAASAIKQYWDNENMRWLIAVTNSNHIMQVPPHVPLKFDDLLTHEEIVIRALQAWPTHVPSVYALASVFLKLDVAYKGQLYRNCDRMHHALVDASVLKKLLQHARKLSRRSPNGRNDIISRMQDIIKPRHRAQDPEPALTTAPENNDVSPDTHLDHETGGLAVPDAMLSCEVACACACA